MDTKFSIAATASGKLEADIIKGMLEAQGVETMLSYEAAATAYGLGVGRLARVEILVRDDQLAEAEAILDDYQSGKYAEEGDEE
ncbi:MAG: DUF2007 domain-containing protein [Anaerolineales bacterium]|jgi:hypothetical protein